MRYSSLFLLAAMVGCSAKSTLIEPKPPTRKLAEFEHLRLRVTITDESARSMYRTANTVITDDLRSRSIFKTVLAEEEEGGRLLLSATITQAAGAGPGTGGAMRTGYGTITILCNLTDIPSGDEVGSFTVSGKSSLFGAGGEAGAYEALGAACREIGKYIQKNK